MSAWSEWLLSALVLVGAFFTLVGSIGLARLGDFFKRLHGPTKATTLGVGCLLLASIGLQAASTGALGLREALVALFLLVTAPISAHLMARAGLQARLAPRPPRPEVGGHSDEARPREES